MEEITVLSVVSLMPSTKQQVESFTASIKQSVLDGDVNPLKLLVQLKMIEKVLDVLKDSDVEKEILREASKYNKDELAEYDGCKLDVRETGVSYDYDVCGDAEYENILQEKKTVDAKIKQRQAFLKNISGDVYGSDGVSIYPPAKSSTTKVVVTIK